MQEIARITEATLENVAEKVSSTAGALETEKKRSQALERELSKKIVESLLTKAEVVKGVKVLTAQLPPTRMEILREMSDMLREKLGSAIVVLGTAYENKPIFLAAVTPDLVAKGYNAGDIVNQVAKVAGGGGGARLASPRPAAKIKAR